MFSHEPAVGVAMRVTVEDNSGQKVIVDGDPGSLTVTKGPDRVWDGTGVAGILIKSSPERRYTLCVAYPANKPDVAIAQDSHRDFANEDVLEDAAWTFLSKSPKVGRWHAEGTEGSGTTVESYIYRGPDWTLTAADGSTQTVKSGDWLVGTVWDEPTWRMWQDGRVNGVSMQGSCTRRKPTAESLARLRR